MNRRGIRLGFAAALAGTSLIAPAIASAAAITWNNTGGSGDGVTWDIATNQNWNNGAPTVYNDGDTVTLADVVTNTHYAITLGQSVAPGSITATNVTSPYTITIAPALTLTSAGDVILGQPTVTTATKVSLTGGGSFSQTGGNLGLGVTNALAAAPPTTLDASGLSSFTYNNSAGQVNVGVGTRVQGILLLANAASSTNSITAASVSVGGSGIGNGGGTSTLTLGGGSNTINATSITIGSGKASANFQGQASGTTLTINGTAGVGSNANITVSAQSSGTATSTTSKLLLNGLNPASSIAAGKVIIGQFTAAKGTSTGTAAFNSGSFTVTNGLLLGSDTSQGASGAGIAGAVGTFTLGTSSTSTGTLDVSGGFIIGNAADTTNQTFARTDSGTFIINGGTASVHSDITSVNAATAVNTLTSTLSLLGGTLNMNGNQIGHVSGNNKIITTVNMPVASTSATLSNLGGTGINDAGLTMNGVGTLILAGTDTYTGITAVNSGTLSLIGNYTRGGAFTVASNATLEGVGSTNGPVTVNSGGFLAPGDAIGTLGVGSATLAGTLEIALNDASTPNVDVLSDSGNLDISSPTSAVNFNVTGTPAQPAYIFADYASLTGSAFAAVTNLPSGYTIDYDYLGNNDIALVAAAVPEPASLGLLGIGAASLLSRRRRTSRA